MFVLEHGEFPDGLIRIFPRCGVYVLQIFGRAGINIGDLFITSYTVVDANTIEAITPAHLPGTFSVELTISNYDAPVTINAPADADVAAPSPSAS